MSRSMQLHYIPVTVFYRPIYFQIEFPWSAMTNHKKLIDVIASLDQDCLSFAKEKVY